MASALLPSSPSLCKSNHPFPANLPIFRYRARSALNPKNSIVREKVPLISCSSLVHNSENGIGRRDLILFSLASPLIFILPSSVALAEPEGDVKMSSVVDEINAYSFLYPVELPSKKYIFKWVESRKPERYSSAAPLSPDARQRIVSERVDIIDNLIISVSIGPPNSQLKSKDKSSWNAKDVADSVLSDKSALRITSAQRMAESSVLDAHSSKIDGEPYWYYEYLVRKSPTNSIQESSVYRHYVASTAERDGYLYSVNASTLGKQWNSGFRCYQCGEISHATPIKVWELVSSMGAHMVRQESWESITTLTSWGYFSLI
ncbi:psbP domain-containing protein 5, chloroplastic isoform X2 [Macadamia integrifolia]|uniref:psbP domain-containing protein 5, chloroplastic isoform X2 n=1 Tax=Macadamia integrifolia TaxID=60698 RepID=UPI001C4F555A|nr:psbP domain-containing protein 5, chloroplastic isoform X2 [Macadamia integrifolia]